MPVEGVFSENMVTPFMSFNVTRAVSIGEFAEFTTLRSTVKDVSTPPLPEPLNWIKVEVPMVELIRVVVAS